MSLRNRILERKEEEFVSWWMDGGVEWSRHKAYVDSAFGVGTWRIYVCDSLTDDELEREYFKWRIEHE